MSFFSFSQQPDTIIDNWKTKTGFIIGTNQLMPINKQLGFLFGLSFDYKLAKKIFFHPQTILSFIPNNSTGKIVKMTVLEIPLHLLYKPFNSKIKPIISFGTNYKFVLSSSDLGWFGDIALGFEKLLKHFTIVPEIRFSYGKSTQILYFTITFKE